MCPCAPRQKACLFPTVEPTLFPDPAMAKAGSFSRSGHGTASASTSLLCEHVLIAAMVSLI